VDGEVGDSEWEGSDPKGGRGKGDLIRLEREAAAGWLRQQRGEAGKGEAMGVDGEFILF
jgi:hypothetical protein